MKRKTVDTPSRTPAAPNAPAPIPAFFADLLISALASSISARTNVDMSAMALCTRVPTEGSSAAVASCWACDTLWATGAPPSERVLRRTAGQGNGAARRPAPPPRLPLILRRSSRQLVLDQVHHRRVRQRRDVAQLPILRDV